MIVFRALALLMEDLERSGDKVVFTESLAQLLTEMAPKDVPALAYLVTSRLGCPNAPRIAWQRMTYERLLTRFKNDATLVTDFLHPVLANEAYLILHAMDPVRIRWFPDNRGARPQLLTLAARCDALELKWLIRIMLGLPNVFEALFLKALAMSIKGDTKTIARRMNKTVPDIGKAAAFLTEFGYVDGVLKLDQICFGTPVPMEKLGRTEASELRSALRKLARNKNSESAPVFVQGKSNGIPIQIHQQGDDILIFNESGEQLRPDALWSDWPKIRAQLEEIPAKLIIVDCEVVGLDPSTGRLVSGSGKSIQEMRINQAKVHQLVVFDLIALDGTDVRRRTYEMRQKEMRRLFPPLDSSPNGGLFLADEILVEGAAGVSSAVEQLFASDRYEGGVLKAPHSRLVGQMWRPKRLKIKEYDSLDLLIVGFFFNQVQHGDKEFAIEGPKKFLLATFNEKTQEFYPCTIAVASKQIEEQLIEHCLSTQSPSPPLDVVPEGRPRSWTDGTLVVEVEIDGMIERDTQRLFPSLGWTLHGINQRMIKDIRIDKTRYRTNTVSLFFSLRPAPGN
jgi:ATP-dependent DNA ligase